MELKSKKTILEIRKVTESLFNEPQILLSFSGGKDSILMFDLFKRAYRGDWKNVTVVFIDEEAVFQGVIENTEQVREEVLDLGGKFEWYCMPFLHFSAISSLKEDGVYMLWKQSEKDKWIRPMPPYAIKTHPEFRAGMSYQEFFNQKIIPKYDLVLQGIRKAESIQRRQVLAQVKFKKYGITGSGVYFPIREFTEPEVWEYFQARNLSFPIEYLYIHQMKAVNRKVTSSSQLRMSQLFSADTLGTLVYLKEFDPKLWERIRIRQPNAYLASMYFGNSFNKDNKFDPKVDYVQATFDFWNSGKGKTPGMKLKRRIAFLLKRGLRHDPKLQRIFYSYYRTAEGKGDPKGRALRGFTLNISDFYDITA